MSVSINRAESPIKRPAFKILGAKAGEEIDVCWDIIDDKIHILAFSKEDRRQLEVVIEEQSHNKGDPHA